MKEAMGEVNFTVVAIVAAGIIIVAITAFLPGLIEKIGNRFDDTLDGSDYGYKNTIEINRNI